MGASWPMACVGPWQHLWVLPALPPLHLGASMRCVITCVVGMSRGTGQLQEQEGQTLTGGVWLGDWLPLCAVLLPSLNETRRLLRSRSSAPRRLASHLWSWPCFSTGSFSSSAAVGRLFASLLRQAATMLSSPCREE